MPPSAYESDQKPQSKGFFSSLLEEFSSEVGAPTRHYLFIDAYYTWWVDGKSYLNRMVDMLHMGFVDEIIIGREVVKAVPTLAKDMVAIFKARS
jgi:hypothetical protein